MKQANFLNASLLQMRRNISEIYPSYPSQSLSWLQFALSFIFCGETCLVSQVIDSLQHIHVSYNHRTKRFALVN